MNDNVIEIAEAAQAKGKFNLSDAIKGIGYPEKSVDIYLDAGSAFKLEELNKELQALADMNKMQEYDKLNVEAQELKNKIIESKLTFHMRGVGQHVVEATAKEADRKFPIKEDEPENPDWIKFYLATLIASNIVKVTDSDGNEDTKKFNVDEILDLRGAIPIDSWELLIDTMQKLTLAGAYFDAVTDAGFLPKS